MHNYNFKKYFLWTLIIALIISSLIGIIIFLLGDFGDTESKILVTTMALGGYSLAGLCCASIYERKNLKIFSIIGMLLSVIGFLVTLSSIWDFLSIDYYWKFILILIILTASIAHISLLLLVKSKSSKITTIQTVTIVFISIVALMFSKSILSDFNESEYYFRFLGVFSILDVLGTIATPILNRIAENPKQD